VGIELFMTGIDRRKLERFTLEIPAHTRIGNNDKYQSYELVTKNICSGGAFLHTNHMIPVGAEVYIDLVIPISKLKNIETHNVLIQVNGSVVRSEINGIAICFQNNYKITPMQS
jgi:Tfp pilus assembly protein PilZ